MPLALFGPMLARGASRNGLTVPNAQAGAISVDPLLAGTASGLAGFLQMFVAALVSQAVGVLQNGTPYPMVGFMTGCAVLSLARLCPAAALGRKDRLVGQELRIEGLGQSVRRGPGKSPLGQPCLDDRPRPCISISAREYRLEIAHEARAPFEVIPQPLPMLDHRVEPASRTALRLELVFQQVEEHDDKVAFDGFLLADAQVLDLLDQVHDIEALESTLAQEPGLLLDPQAEVALVERSTFLGHRIRACHLGVSMFAAALL